MRAYSPVHTAATLTSNAVLSAVPSAFLKVFSEFLLLMSTAYDTLARVPANHSLIDGAMPVILPHLSRWRESTFCSFRSQRHLPPPPWFRPPAGQLSLQETLHYLGRRAVIYSDASIWIYAVRETKMAAPLRGRPWHQATETSRKRRHLQSPYADLRTERLTNIFDQFTIAGNVPTRHRSLPSLPRRGCPATPPLSRPAPRERTRGTHFSVVAPFYLAVTSIMDN